MRSRTLMLIGFAAGYILGARAGRERYLQISRLARSAWTSDTARRMRDQAGKAAGQVSHKAAEVVHLAGHRSSNDGAQDGDLTAPASMFP